MFEKVSMTANVKSQCLRNRHTEMPNTNKEPDEDEDDTELRHQRDNPQTVRGGSGDLNNNQ